MINFVTVCTIGSRPANQFSPYIAGDGDLQIFGCCFASEVNEKKMKDYLVCQLGVMQIWWQRFCLQQNKYFNLDSYLIWDRQFELLPAMLSPLCYRFRGF